MGISRKTVAMMSTQAQAQVAEELEKAYPKPPPRNKFGNKRVTVQTDDGEQRFDSKSEMRRFFQLKRLEEAGEISGLKRQPSFPLHVNGFRVGEYRADFGYLDAEGEWIYEDVKGMEGVKGKVGGTMTPLSAMKIKMVFAEYQIQIRIVSA